MVGAFFLFITVSIGQQDSAGIKNGQTKTRNDQRKKKNKGDDARPQRNPGIDSTINGAPRMKTEPNKGNMDSTATMTK